MKIYLLPINKEYKLQASEKKRTVKDKLVKIVKKFKEGKIKSTLEKYVTQLENSEETTLKMAYSFEDIEIHYAANLLEHEAKEKCKNMSRKYLKKNIMPLIAYSILCPVTFVIAPVVPMVNWVLTFFLGYKAISKYKCMRGYNKILNSDFIKDEKGSDLESIIKKMDNNPDFK